MNFSKLSLIAVRIKFELSFLIFKVDKLGSGAKTSRELQISLIY